MNTNNNVCGRIRVLEGVAYKKVAKLPDKIPETCLACPMCVRHDFDDGNEVVECVLSGTKESTAKHMDDMQSVQQVLRRRCPLVDDNTSLTEGTDAD